ncbi:MAG: hypothetical protein J7M26_05395, partial [Armatimonadetes bacterium]|nr:hypothetical protein [Armatimonadota bacterium]
HTLHVAIMAYVADHDRRLPVVSFRDLSRHVADTYPMVTPPNDYAPPWPNAPEPPLWYSLRVPLDDYVDDPRTFFCPSHPKPLPGWAHYPSRYWMSYTENDGMAGMSLDDLTWPPEYASLLGCPSLKMHLGRMNVLYLSGQVKSLDWPQGCICLRTPWKRAKPIVLGPDAAEKGD